MKDVWTRWRVEVRGSEEDTGEKPVQELEDLLSHFKDFGSP